MLLIPNAFRKDNILTRDKGLRGIRLADVGNLLVPKTDGVGRIASVVVPAAIEYFKDLFRHELRIVFIKESCGVQFASGVLGSVASLVGDNEFYVPAPPQRPVSLLTIAASKIVDLLHAPM